MTKKSFLVDLLSWFHCVMIFAPLFMFFAYIAKPEKRELFIFAALAVVLLIPVITSHFMLRKIRIFAIYLLLSFLLTGLIFAGAFVFVDLFPNSNLLAAFLLGACSLAIYILRGYSKIVHSELKQDFIATHDEGTPFLMDAWEVKTFINAPSPVHWVWFIILYIMALLVKQHYLLVEIFYFLIADIFICFIYSFHTSFFNYMRMTDQVVNMPVSTMKHVHKTLFYGGLLAILLFLLPAILYGEEPLEKVKMPDYIVVDTEMARNDLIEYAKANQEKNTEMEDLLRQYEDKNPPEWIAKLFAVLIYTALGFFILLLIIGIIKALKYYARNFRDDDQDDVLFLEDIEDEILKLPTENRFSKNQSINKKIRRKYKKIIKDKTDGFPKSSATPSELERNAGLSEDSKNVLLHDYYEKARYSQEKLTKDDLNKLK